MNDDILETMFNNLVVYVWNNPGDDEDCGSLLISSEDLAVVQDLTENLKTTYRQANSFRDLKHLLNLEEIYFFDLTDGLYIYNYVEE